jgi:hypothetical protein
MANEVVEMPKKRKFKIELGAGRLHTHGRIHQFKKQIGCREFTLKLIEDKENDNEMPTNVSGWITDANAAGNVRTSDLPQGYSEHWTRLGVLCLQVALHMDNHGEGDPEMLIYERAAKRMLKAMPNKWIRKLTRDGYQ